MFEESHLAIGTLISLAIYFIVMLAIGLYAYKKSTRDVAGYMLRISDEHDHSYRLKVITVFG